MRERECGIGASTRIVREATLYSMRAVRAYWAW